MDIKKDLVDWLEGERTKEIYDRLLRFGSRIIKKKYYNNADGKIDDIFTDAIMNLCSVVNVENPIAYFIKLLNHGAVRIMFEKEDLTLRNHFRNALKKSNENGKPVVIHKHVDGYFTDWWKISSWGNPDLINDWELIEKEGEIKLYSSVVDVSTESEKNLNTNNTILYCEHILNTYEKSLTGKFIYKIYSDQRSIKTISLSTSSANKREQDDSSITIEDTAKSDFVFDVTLKGKFENAYNVYLRDKDVQTKILIFLYVNFIDTVRSVDLLKEIGKYIDAIKPKGKSTIANLINTTLIPILKDLISDVSETAEIDIRNLRSEMFDAISKLIAEDILAEYKLEISINSDKKLEVTPFYDSNRVNLKTKGSQNG